MHSHTEEAVDYRSVVSTRRREKHGNMTEAIGQSAAYTAINLKVKAVLAPTRSGHTAKMIAKYRPGCPVIALNIIRKKFKKAYHLFGEFTQSLEKKCTSIDEILQEIS